MALRDGRLSLIFATAIAALTSQSLADDPPVAQQAPPERSPLERAVLGVLRNDPVTAPYLIDVAIDGRRLVLSGRVGSSFVHDEAVRVALDFTPSIDDRLVIDTATAYLAAPPPPPPFGYPAAVPPPFGYFPGAPGFGYPSAAAFPSIYTGPWGLPGYGGYDFDPPTILYPPWWPALSARRLAESAPMAPEARSVIAPTDPARANRDLGTDPNALELTIDGDGVAILRGRVGSLAERIAIGRELTNTPGIAEVINLLEIGPVPVPVEKQSEPDPAPAPAPELEPPDDPTLPAVDEPDPASN